MDGKYNSNSVFSSLCKTLPPHQGYYVLLWSIWAIFCPFYGSWKRNTSPWKEVAVNLYWNVESVILKYQCLIDEEAQIPAMVQCQRIDMSGLNVLWRFMWIQTYQSSMKYWQVGIELTFVDLLEHFIMDSTVLCKLMTLALSLARSLYLETAHMDRFWADSQTWGVCSWNLEIRSKQGRHHQNIDRHSALKLSDSDVSMRI